MTSGIYKVTIGDHFYYGSSRNLESRRRNHESDLRRGKHGNSYMQRCWDKYGDFKFEVVQTCEVGELSRMEGIYLDEFHGKPDCLNLLTSRFSRKTQPTSEETKAKLRAKALGRKHSPEVIQRMRGHKVSTETRQKISDSLRGRKIPADIVERVAATNRANTATRKSMGISRTMSPEARKKMSEAAKGRKLSPETIARRTATYHRNRLKSG